MNKNIPDDFKCIFESLENLVNNVNYISANLPNYVLGSANYFSNAQHINLK
jgi:hypothetical protein